MSYILLIIPILFFIAIYTRKLKEPMVGYCYSEKMPYHSKEVHLESKDLRKKIRTIKKSLNDKASWEHRKINSYIPEYSTTQNNDLKTDPQEFELRLSNSMKHSIDPVLTQFDSIQSNDKTPSYYVAPSYTYQFNKRFNTDTKWAPPPYNSPFRNEFLTQLNFQNYP